MSTISKENYLKTIFNLTSDTEGSVTTSQLAEKLEISNAATSDMAKKLSEQGLIKYIKYKGMELTENGERIAVDVVRRHRLWELFLMEVLDLSWGEVHDEAENLEHHSSDFLIDKIERHLGYPKFDPHGEPIPQKDGVMPQVEDQISLNNGEPGRDYKIVRVYDKSSELIEHFTKLGLLLQTKLKIIDRLEFDKSLVVNVDGRDHSLSSEVAKRIFVSEIENLSN